LTAGKSRKQSLQAAAAHVMQAVNSLIPTEYRPERPELLDERFELQIAIRDQDGMVQPAPSPIRHAASLSKIFYRPAILRIFSKDLHRPVDALQRLETERDPLAIAKAVQPILDYVENENPGFFTYRFGHRQGLAMQAGLSELSSLATWAAGQAYSISVKPIRHYRLPDGQERTDLSPGQTHLW
jgi:hypothetical protein